MTFQYFTQAYTLTNGRGDPNNATLFINLDLFREAFAFNQMGYGAGHRLAPVRDRPGPDPGPVRLRPEARLLRGAETGRPPSRQKPLRSFTDRGPIARSYRKYLGRASLFMFAMVLVSAYLLPLLYMVTTAFQQPGQASTPGAPVYPAAPQTGTYQGQAYPIYAVPIEGTTRQLMLVEKGRESSTFVDPADPRRTPIVWQGRWRTLAQAWTFAPEIENFTTAWSQLNFPRLLFNTAAIAVLSTLGCRHLGRPRRVRLRPLPLPGSRTSVHRPDRDDHPAVPGDPPAAYVIFTKLGWNGTWLPLIVPTSSPTPTTSSCSASTSCRSRATSTRPR